MRSLQQIDYFHVELECHDILLAEDTPAESFVDDGNRGMFHNAPEWRAVNADIRHAQTIYCAPRVSDGFALDAIRQAIAGRAYALSSQAADALPLQALPS